MKFSIENQKLDLGANNESREVHTQMGKWLDKELSEITDGKEIIINCPRVTVNVEIDGKKERRTYHDITQVFDDFEEGKVMGRIWRFGKER